MDCGHRDITMMYCGIPNEELWIGYVNSAEIGDLIRALQYAAEWMHATDKPHAALASA